MRLLGIHIFFYKKVVYEKVGLLRPKNEGLNKGKNEVEGYYALNLRKLLDTSFMNWINVKMGHFGN